MIPITLADALDKTNNHGRYQIRLFVLCALFAAQDVFHICLDVFTAKPMPWRYTWEDTVSSRPTLPPCNSSMEWVYSYNLTISITSEFGLYCNPLKLRLITAAHFAGRLCGFIVFWNLTVVFGRRWPLVISIWCNSIVTWLLSCSTTYEVYVILRVLDGFSLEGYVVGGYVLLLECVNEKSRQIYSTQFRSLQGVGFVALAIAGYLCSTWKVLCLVAGMLITIHGLFAGAFVPESPKWLLAKGRGGDVVSFIHNVAKCNDRRIKDQFYIVDMNKTRQPESFTGGKEFFLTRISLLCVWMCLYTAEYMLYLNILQLPGNAFLNLMLLGICDIPGRALPIVMMDKWGRKNTLFILNILAGGFLLVCCVDNNIVRCVFYMITKLVLAGNIIVIKVYTYELSPKSDHSSVFRMCMCSTRVVGIGVPFLLMLNNLQTFYVYAICGGLIVLSSFFILPLPETNGQVKPETVDDFIGMFYSVKFRPHKTAKLPSGFKSRKADQSKPGTSNMNEDKIENADPDQIRVRRPATRSQSVGANKTPKKALDEISTTSFDISAISNMDVGNLSLFDPDIHHLKNTRSPITRESTRLSSGFASPVRPNSLKLNTRRANLSRNLSYESSLDSPSLGIISETPSTITSNNQVEATIKRNSLVSFTPKSSVKKQFFSLSRV